MVLMVIVIVIMWCDGTDNLLRMSDNGTKIRWYIPWT